MPPRWHPCPTAVVTATSTRSLVSACAHTAGRASSVRWTPSQHAETRLVLLWRAQLGRSRYRAPVFVSASRPARSWRTCESLGAHRCAPGVALTCPGSSIEQAKCSVRLSPPSTHSEVPRSRSTTGGTGSTSRGHVSIAALDVARASAARASAQRVITGRAALTSTVTRHGRRRYRPRGCGSSCTTWARWSPAGAATAPTGTRRTSSPRRRRVPRVAWRGHSVAWHSVASVVQRGAWRGKVGSGRLLRPSLLRPTVQRALVPPYRGSTHDGLTHHPPSAFSQHEPPFSQTNSSLWHLLHCGT